MKSPTSRLLIFGLGGMILLILIIVIATLALTPAQTNPAFAAAVSFVDAAARGNDAAAQPYLSDALQTYVAESCPSGSVSTCVEGYIPDEWGAFQSIVFRRATPDGDGWHVDLIGTWELDRGFSGVCVYANMQQEDDGQWRVQRWAGFAWCGEAGTRNMQTNPDAPNQAP
jgi:hypothetical protein